MGTEASSQRSEVLILFVSVKEATKTIVIRFKISVVTCKVDSVLKGAAKQVVRHFSKGGATESNIVI